MLKKILRKLSLALSLIFLVVVGGGGAALMSGSIIVITNSQHLHSLWPLGLSIPLSLMWGNFVGRSWIAVDKQRALNRNIREVRELYEQLSKM